MAATTDDPNGRKAAIKATLARLRRASDRLAELREATSDSRLKGTPGGVDLKVRRGVG